MSPEEKAVRMMLLDYTPEQQEFYRQQKDRLLESFKSDLEGFEDSDEKDLFLAALSIALNQFIESLTGE